MMRTCACLKLDADPPDFPHENFVECERLEIQLEVPRSKWKEILTWRKSAVPLKKHPNFECVAVVKVRYLEFDGVMLNFEMWNRKLNINEISKSIANAEVSRKLVALHRPLDAFPNCLRVKVIRARNLPRNEHNVFAKDKTCDPVVYIRAREQVHSTAVRFNTREPMWNDATSECAFHVSDASTVLHITVCNKDLTLNGFVGQWIMTLKYLFTDPLYNYHNSIEVKGPGSIRGWFPLKSRRFHRLGECGEIELEIEWFHNPALAKVAPPCVSAAMAQLKQNSTETNLRLGCREQLKKKLNSVPLLFDIDRVTLRNVDVFVKDLFMGRTGHAEILKSAGKSPDSAHSIKIDLVDFRKLFRPKYGDPGIPCYKVVHRFFAKGVPPVILEAKVLGSAISHSTSGFVYHLNDSLRRFFSGKDLEKNVVTGFQSFGKKVGKGFQSVGFRMKMKGKMLASNASSVKRVSALDDAFLQPPTCKGTLEKATLYGKKKGFKRNLVQLYFRAEHFELKGNFLFYGTKQLSEPRKLRLDDVHVVVFNERKDHIEIHYEDRTTFLRVPKAKPPESSTTDRKRLAYKLSLIPSKTPESTLLQRSSSHNPMASTSLRPFVDSNEAPLHRIGTDTLINPSPPERDATLREWFQAIQSLGVTTRHCPPKRNL